MPHSSPLPILIEVLLPKPLAHPFHYLIPDEWQARAVPGVRAVVPFGHEVVTGVIVHTGAPPPAAARGRLRSIQQLVDDTPLLSAELLGLLRQLADDYFVPWGELLHAAIPASLLPTGERRYHLVQPAQTQPGRSRPAQHVIALLQRHPKGLSHATLVKHCATTSTTRQTSGTTRLTSLLKRLITTKQISVTWQIKPLKLEKQPFLNQNNTTLLLDNGLKSELSSHFNVNTTTGELHRLTDMITAKKHNVLVYLTPDHGPKHGDQVYLAAAAATVRAGRSLLLLAPEISRVEALAGWLQNQMTSCPVISLHSELTSSILAQRWLALRAASPPVIVVGSRLALFAPLPSPGLIVVDEEADPLYKQEERPRLHARDLAIRRGEQSNIPVLLSARAPSVETYWQCCAGRYHWLTPGPGAGPEPEIDGPGPDPRSINAPPLISTGRLVVIDLRTEPLSDGLLTKPLIDALAARVARGEQSLLFVNRRGYAHSLICRDCGELVRCADCRIGLTYYESAGADGSHLRCRRCGVRLSPPTLCPHCQGHRLGPLGTGTQRVENAVRRRWPDARIVRVDRDVAVQSGREIGSGASDALAAADVLIGTQRCLHAPPPPRLSLVAVLDAELDLSHPDFRAEERQLQLLIRLQGLLQPAIDSSIALVQSRQPDRPILQALTTGRLEAFYTEEIAQRRSLGYPPFRRLAALLLRGRPVANRAIVDQLASAIREQLAAQQGEAVELWGPIPAPPTSHTSMTRHGNTAAWELLLKAETASGLHRSLQAVTRLPLAVRLREAHAMEIEVDPA